MNSLHPKIPALNVGCTSFIIPDTYVPAIRECVKYADEVALLLLEAGRNGCDLITPAEIQELAIIGRDSGITWNVHLPTDGGFATPESSHQLTENIIRAIDLTRELQPHSWVMHVVNNPNPSKEMMPYMTEREYERVLSSLEQISQHLPTPEHLALENLERHPTDYLDQVLAHTRHSRCFDIGHVWKEGLCPEPLFHEWQDRIRMCHLHGLNGRDHQSLYHMPHEHLDAMLHALWDASFMKPITLEVFSLDDYLTSCRAIQESYQRYVRVI
jgi:sugar phosphate isomerase/epimerase